MNHSPRTIAIGGAALLAFALAGTAQAQDNQSVAEFYEGKTITLLIGFSAGGEYDMLARLVARHMGEYIPGNPEIVPQNLPGGGGLTMTGQLFNTLPQDGTYLGMTNNAFPTMQAAGVEGMQFDMAEFGWIGSVIPTVETMAVWHETGVETIEELTQTEVVAGASGRTSITYTFPLMMNELLGTQFSIVPGYPGGNDINHAMENGEVGARNNTWSSWNSTRTEGQWLEQGMITVVAYAGPTPDDMPDSVPAVGDLVDTEEDRQLVRLITAGTELGRPIITTPNVPEERLEALREAFRLMVQDPDFLAEAEAANVDVDPIFGEQMQAAVEEVLSYSDAVKERARAILED